MHLGGMQQSDSLHMLTDEKHMKIKLRTSLQANTDNHKSFNHRPFTKIKRLPLLQTHQKLKGCLLEASMAKHLHKKSRNVKAVSSKNFKVPYVYDMTTMVCDEEDDDNSMRSHMQSFTFAGNHMRKCYQTEATE